MTEEIRDSRSSFQHFEGKSALSHVAEARVKGKIALSEVHGEEISSSYFSALEAVRDTAIIILIFASLFSANSFSLHEPFTFIFTFFVSWLIWKISRVSWLGWSGLERLHRILEQEKWEIEHNRAQEREELKVLYEAKGFQGVLLEEVLDVLMADGDRLLKIMLEEELGFSLEMYEHPLKQGLFAGFGVFLTASISLLAYFLWPTGGLYIGGFLALLLSSLLLAFRQRNALTSAIIWNLAIGCLVGGSAFFLFSFLNL